MEITKENCNTVMELFDDNQDEALDNMSKMLETYISTYSDLNDEELKIYPTFLDHTQLVYTLIHDFYTHEEIMTEIEKEKETCTNENELKEINEYLEFVEKLKIVKSIFTNTIFTMNAILSHKHIIDEINSYIKKQTQSIKELGDTMKKMNDKLLDLHNALELMAAMKQGPPEDTPECLPST